jgi:EAL domain-containing protein (putative c-di-GMP-specific phosphodiesterase class I)
MAHSLGLGVVAEGIETEHQRDYLAELGVAHGQGFLFSRPVPAADLASLMARVIV